MSAECNVSNGINWDDLPDNANWVAMDKDGQWYWYESEPYKDNRAWLADENASDTFEADPCDDWTASLQSRPSTSAAVQSPAIKEDADGWIPWNGDMGTFPPVSRDALVSVRYDDDSESGYDIACCWFWGRNTNIVAYKVYVPDAPEDTTPTPTAAASYDLSWALAQVFQHRKLVTRADMEEASHWRLGLFIPVNSGQRQEQLVWTNGTDWHPCVIDADDYNGTWKVYDILD